MLRRSPIFTLTVILTLALGIGANTAIFTVVNSVLLKALPYPEPNRLVAIWDAYQPQFPKLGVSPVEYDEWSRQSDIFEQIGRYRHIAGGKELNLTGGTDARRVQATCVSSSLFRILGIRPVLGRVFGPGDDGPNGPATVLLGQRLWSEYFGANPNVVGSPIQLNGQAFTVAGVLPADFHLPSFADLWLPEGQAADEITNPVRHGFGVIARLKHGVSEHQAAARLDSIAQRLERERPRTSKNFRPLMSSLRQDQVGNLRPALIALFGAVTLVLLIACVNVANLLLSRAATRRRETAIRIALGASRWRIVRESLSDSIRLSLAGGAAGLLLAYVGLGSLLRLVPTKTLDPSSIQMDLTTLAFLAGISLLTGVLFGMIPALQAARQDPNQGLKEGGRNLSGGAGTGRNVLVIAEVSLALMLLMGAGLLIQSFARLIRVNPGFQPAHVLTLRLLPPQGADTDVKLESFFERIQSRILSLPGVTSVAAVSALLGSPERGNVQRFSVPGSPLMRPDAFPVAERRLITPDYFKTLGIPLVAGRNYTARDLPDSNVIVNESMARTYWPGQNSIGQKFITGVFGTPSYSTVIGVAGDVKQFGLDSERTNDFYFLWYGPTYLTIRTSSDPLSLASAVRKEIQAVNPAVPVSDFRTMEQVLDASSGGRRFSTMLLTVFAGVALALALIGIYGIMSWSVAQRTREIGIRMVVGADRRGILGLILGHALKLSLIGLAIGLAATLALSKFLQTLLFEISPRDPWILGGVSLLMILVTAAACYIPAQRATEVDPIATLRAE
jgi:putative ABC transport system permease protein